MEKEVSAPYSMASSRPGSTDVDDVDLTELLYAIWSQKYKVIIVTFIFSIFSVIYALSKPDLYKSTALLAPVESSSSGGQLSSLAGQFGGLASIAGVNLGNQGSERVEEAIAILKSRDFITKFVRDNDLLVPLFALAPTSFSKNVAINPEVYDEESGEWLRNAKPPFTKEPTDWEIYKKFSSILQVTTNKTTGMISVSIEWFVPSQSAMWVTLLVQKINLHLKNRDVDEAKKSIQFIKEKIQEVSLVDMQAIFYGLIESYGKTIMLAEVRDEYAFRTIDPAVIPLEKSQPKRALISVLGTIFGLMVGVFFALVIYFASKRKRRGV